jgi:tetratricopeptide (TPR) repeat protein
MENAIPAMRLAVTREPKKEAYHVRYGMLLTDAKAPAAAIIRLQESLKEFPRSSRLWLALGIAQLVNGLGADAQNSFEQAYGLDPKSVATLAYLGTAHAERGQYDEAVRFYELAISADEKIPVPYYLAADALLKRVNIDNARVEKYLRRAIELDPNFASARSSLAKLYTRSERWAEAAAQLERVIELDPTRADAHYQLGQLYVRLKRPTEAQKLLATFKRMSEEQKEQKDSERRALVRRLADVRF